MHLGRLRKINITILKILITFIAIVIHLQVVQGKPHDIIKVGYTSSKGFIEKQGDLYTGYLYDYLKEISIYTHWEYEFIEMDMENALEALKNGKIDLMGAMFNNEQTAVLFDFPKYDMGYTYNTLLVSADHDFDRSTYVVLDGIKIGYLETAKKTLEHFNQFCADNGVQDVVLTPFDSSLTQEALIQKLNDGEVDAILGRDLSTNGIGGKVAAKFGAQPYYFATTKGNTEVINGLNKALLRIKEQNGSFEKALYDKYFEQDYLHLLILSKDQEAYIKTMNPLKVGYVTNYIPVQYYNEYTHQPDGIFVRYIKRIAQRMNMPLEFIKIPDQKSGYELLQKGEIDVVLGILDDYLIADQYNFILTKSIYKLDMQKIVNKELILQGNTKNKKKIFAIPKVYTIFEDSTNAMAQYYSVLEEDAHYVAQYYQTSEESVRAVNEGKAAVTHVSSYIANHCMAQDIYDNIAIYPSGEQISLAIGISKAIDENLLYAITKSIYSFSEQESRTITDEVVSELYTKETLSHFVKTHLEGVIIGTVFVLGCISLLITLVVKMRFARLEEGKRLLFEKTQLDALTGIYNREACERLIKEYLETKDPALHMALIIIDVDYFKQINDRFGHRMGDHLLVEFSAVLNHFFGYHDIVSRLGGDEFVVFMTDIAATDIIKVQEKLGELCQLMHKQIEHNGETQEISLSVGAVITKEVTEFNPLYAMADEMLYEVKRNGRNGFKIKQIN